MKKLITMLLLFFVMSSVSHAAQWVKLQENKSAKLMLDKQSILQQGLLKRAWIKIEFKAPRTSAQMPDKDYNTAKLLWFFDCTAQKSATTQVLQYLNGELIYSAGTEAKNVEFTEPVPETEVDIAMRYVCAPPKAETEAAPVVKKPAKVEAKPAAASKDAAVKPAATPVAQPAVKPAEKAALPAGEKTTAKVTDKVTDKATDKTIDKATDKATDKVKSTDKVAPKTATGTIKTSAVKEADAKTAKVKKTDWSYSGAEGPEHWGKLNPAFSACDSGLNQSPVNIEKALVASLKPLKSVQIHAAKDIVNNGNTVLVNFKPGNTLQIDNTPFLLQKLSFHTPSEHKIQNKAYPLEAQFLYADSEGNQSIIAVMFTNGKANAALASLWAKMPNEVGAPVALTKPVLPTELMPKNPSYFRFSGSLTTPPCSEGVRWIIMKTPMTASTPQIVKLERALRYPNNRPLQALNGRLIVE
jgi:carbonic anhydrase